MSQDQSMIESTWAEARDLESLPLKEAMTEYKRRHIRDALARAGGNQTRAAAMLGLQRTHLNRLLKELGIDSGRSGTPTEPDTGSRGDRG